MLFNHKYKGSSSVGSSSGKMGISFAPDTLREPTFFVGSLHDKLNFREAISALHHVVIADFKFKPSNKEEYKKGRKQTKARKNKGEIAPMEVDLHIDKLIKSSRGMDNYDILSLQMDTAKHKLEFAIRNRIPRIVFIHGVGEGVLKSELEFLFKNYQVSYYAASFKKYGLGATEVYVYQNKK